MLRAQGVEASVLAGTIEQLRQSTATWVAAGEAEMRAMRAELAELREFQRVTLEAEERVRSAACSPMHRSLAHFEYSDKLRRTVSAPCQL